MSDRTEDCLFPELPGPWPRVDDERIFDHGARWCVNAAGHAGVDRQYPDVARHTPPFECRTRGLVIDAADGLDGPPCYLEVYGARAYRFGELREAVRRSEPKVILDFETDADVLARFSVSRGDALRIARHLVAAVASMDE